MNEYISKNIADEFIEAITNFATGYISRIKVSIFSHASEIADDDILRTLLLEYNRRMNEYKKQAARNARNIILHGMNLSDSIFDDSCWSLAETPARASRETTAATTIRHRSGNRPERRIS